MEKKKNNRDQWLHLRLTIEEQQKIQEAFSRTTQRKISDYARKILLGKPMIATYRNASLDDLMQELLLLRKDLNGLANNFNQAVHKLHTLDHDLQVKYWAEHYEKQREILLIKVEEMRELMAKIGAAWLQ
jgi:hypothetical protein